MQLVDQKLGTVGDIHASIVEGKLVIGVDGSLDIPAQLEKLKAHFSSPLEVSIISAAEAGLVKLTPAAPAASV